MEKLLKDSSSKGCKLGGKGTGTLKKTTVVKLSSYYKSAIYSNKNDITAMRNAVLATLHHSTSTDEKYNHDYCPSGETSWCFYQKATANKKEAGPHKTNISTPLKPEYFKKLLPIYERLSSEDLLARCVGCKTQNSNESLHNMIWHKCPKEKFVGKERVEIAAAFAICENNFGISDTVRALFDELILNNGTYTQKIGKQRDLKRLEQNDVRNTLDYKKNRKRKAFQETKNDSKKTKLEEVGYKAGEF